MTTPAAPIQVAGRSNGLIGRGFDGLSTPALLLDLDAARRNIAAMAARMRQLQANLRPHVKLHKCPPLAQLQVGAGAEGICVATAWEALAMAQAGLTDIFVVNEVWGAAKQAALAQAAGLASVRVAIDSSDNARDLAAAAVAAGVSLGVLIDVDTGMGRCGVRSAAEAVALAGAVTDVPGIALLGVTGYEGHCMGIKDRAKRAAAARRAMDHLAAVAYAIRQAGHACDTVSAGGTGTFDMTGLDRRVTEIQAGSYVVMDAFHGGLVSGFETALTVLATIISTHGREIVVDAGRKAVGVDLAEPQLADLGGDAVMVNEEHAVYRIATGPMPGAGGTVRIVPGYAPTTVNLYDAMAVLEAGVVTDVWPVLARYGTATFR
jgi:D-threonine aldolase